MNKNQKSVLWEKFTGPFLRVSNSRRQFFWNTSIPPNFKCSTPTPFPPSLLYSESLWKRVTVADTPCTPQKRQAV